jgi:peroxiredoxin Q/BCP
VAYFAASVDDAETNRRFAQSVGADYPILADPGKTVAEAYGVLVPERGVANRWTFYIGKDGRILFIDRRVTPLTAAKDIAARLADLDVARKATKTK